MTERERERERKKFRFNLLKFVVLQFKIIAVCKYIKLGICKY